MEIVLPKFRLLDATQKSDDSIKKNIDIYGIESQISSLRNHDHNRIRLAKNTKINANISNRIHHVNDDIDPNKIKNRTRNSESFSSQKTLVNKDPELFEDNDSIMESIDEEPINVDEQLNNDEKIIENMSTLNNNMQKEGFHPLRQTNSELSVLIILVSLGSYILGYFGFAFIWIVLLLYQCVNWYINTMKNDIDSIIWKTKREISMNKLKRDEGETVEWLNYLLQQIWQTFDPSLLVGLRDMLEDAMSRSAPSFVRATDIEAFEIGLVAPRIESIKIFPLSESNNDDVVIGEARFSFRARSSKTIQDPPPHILAWIKTGISALIPIRVELLALIASIHFEIKLTGTSPFVSTARISFLNIPVYETSIMPLIPMNIAQFPLIKQFIRSAVHSVLEELTYPKFRDINLAELLSTYNDTQSIGIMKVDIFRAINLTKVDVHGENDPYVLSSLDPTPYAHTHNSTRIIENCANPEWNETFFHKIPQLDLVDQHIKFKLSVMDWDRFTPDDLIGNVWIDIKNAIGDGTKGVKIHDGLHDIYLKTTDSSSRGQLQFRLEYFPKSPNDAEPSHVQTSGILGLQIHQAMGLQVTAAPYVKETSGIVLSDNVYNATFPNPYCVVYVNDTRVFRTRAKLNNTAPYWNASTEQFVKDWRTAIVRIVVKDQKDLEYDPVIGIATIPLKGLLEHKGKQGAKWYPLRHGVGCGKVRLSFVFKTIAINLSPEEKGYDVGTLLVDSIVAEDLDPKLASNHMSLTLSLCGSSEDERFTIISHGNPPRWLVTSNCAEDSSKLQFGVLRRHRTRLIITLKQRGIFGITHTVGTATLWLRNIRDCKDIEVKLPIYEKYSEDNGILQDQTVQEEQSTNNLTNNIESQESHEETTSNEPQESHEETTSNEPQESHEETTSNEQSHKEIISNEAEQSQHEIIYEEPQQLNTSNESQLSTNNITPKELSQQEDHRSFSLLSNDTKKQFKNEIKGYLKVKLYFRPGLSTAHEEHIRKSLTGVDASILELNPFQSVNVRREDNETEFDIEERSVPDDFEMFESEIASGRRINRVHRRQTIRQLQWVKDLVRAQVTKKMTGKKDWEEQEIIEYEA